MATAAEYTNNLEGGCDQIPCKAQEGNSAREEAKGGERFDICCSVFGVLGFEVPDSLEH